MKLWRPTHECGVVLQQRVVNSSENWERYTLRSVRKALAAPHGARYASCTRAGC